MGRRSQGVATQSLAVGGGIRRDFRGAFSRGCGELAVVAVGGGDDGGGGDGDVAGVTFMLL